MMWPAPASSKWILFIAVGTTRPSASFTATVKTLTSSPSALIFARSGVNSTDAGTPVVSTLVSETTRSLS